MSRKLIERRWIKNLQKTPLVDAATGRFQLHLAYQVYYSQNREDYPDEYPRNYEGFRNEYRELALEACIERITKYVHFVGIHLHAARLREHLVQYPHHLDMIVRKVGEILRHLAHSGQIDFENPYRDCYKEIFFLLLIQTGESIDGIQTTIFDQAPIPELHKKTFPIPEGYDAIPEVRELFQAIEHSNESYYITGKAGTGKSTFIHYFIQNSDKKRIVLAFTGIAAINVGGQTIHSFFQLPIRPILPADDGIPKFGKGSGKWQVLSEVQTIIIDEISMLRVDILEAIDHSLRINGGRPDLPFGGKQMILVGDIFQLPPVVNMLDEVERDIFTEEYFSEYFFASPAFKALKPKLHEFQKVHRQADMSFIGVLDKFRMGDVSDEDIDLVNTRIDPEFEPKQNEFNILLTSANAMAKRENSVQLEKLPFTKYAFEARIEGEYRVDRFPTQRILELAKDAQVMFITNDYERRWVNGTIGRINFITNDMIEVRLADGRTVQVYQHIWENVKFSWDRAKRKIITEVIGRYTQYPLRLAWAITIHKSQGLTFEKVRIDLGNGAFVNGQTYTALSRCRSLEGITLRRPIRREDVIIDQRLMEFYFGDKRG